MRIRVLILAAVGVLAMSGPALAQSGGSGGSGEQGAHAGGSSVSGGSTSSSASVSTSGSSVGVVQGNVAEGSSGSTSQGSGGDQSGAASSGGSGGGQTVGAAGAPNAVSDGVLRKLDLPAIGTATDATPARSTSAATVAMWAAAAVLALGLATLYRRLPRPTSA